MNIRHRIRTLERLAEHRPEDARARWIAEGRRMRHEFLTHFPADLRPTVDAALDSGIGEETGFHSLLAAPFAPWAPPTPADYLFPRDLVAWMLTPPRAYWMGHHCERCGLTVPLFYTWSNDPDPPPTVAAFPVCPACGGHTSYAAYSRPAAGDAGGESCA